MFTGGLYPIEFLFYYRECFDTKNIRTALSKLSSTFWPVFGQYADGVILFENYREEDCYDEETINHDFTIPETEEERLAVYHQFTLPDLKRLFFLKIIRFTNGMAAIPKLNHLGGDGYSYFYFLSVLASLTHKTIVPFKSSLTSALFKPHHNRTAVRDFSFEGVVPKLSSTGEDFTIEFEEISKEEVRSLIAGVASASGEKISRNDLLSAVALKKIVVAQSGLFAETVLLTIPIDVRRYIKEYGQRFFGNGLQLHVVRLAKELIESSSIEEIALEIRRSMPVISRESYIDYLQSLEEIINQGRMEELKPFDPEKGCLVTNISRLPVDKLNFGTGSPEYIFPLTVERHSTAITARDQSFLLILVN